MIYLRIEELEDGTIQVWREVTDRTGGLASQEEVGGCHEVDAVYLEAREDPAAWCQVERGGGQWRVRHSG